METHSNYQPKRLFTVEEANATLPLVRAITADLMKLSQDVIERRERLETIRSSRDGGMGELYDEEFTQIEDELERDTDRLREFVDELHQIGVEPKGFPEGLIDFPSLMDDRLVFLCWKYGEPEVLHWHEIEGGFGGRQPLTADSLSGPSDGDEKIGQD